MLPLGSSHAHQDVRVHHRSPWSRGETGTVTNMNEEKSARGTIVTEADANNNYYAQESLPSPVTHSVPASPPPRTFGNPMPLGMLAYGTVFLCSSLLTLGTASVHTANLVLVYAMFYGGISQSLVGHWELFLGNTFAGTVFATYGGFNFTYGALYLPELGLSSAYGEEEFVRAIGIFLAIWCLITFVFCLGSFRTTLPVVACLTFTVFALACLSANCFTGNPHLNTAGGIIGLLATFSAYYGALSGFWSSQSTFEFIRLPPVVLARV